MTLQNLRYIVEVARCRSFSKAAQALFMTQSALSAAVRETEEELGIQIFHRTNRGVTLTADGEDCVRHCREIVERSDYLAARYQNRDCVPTYFSVSAQHLPFAVRAFNELMESLPGDRYDVAFRETPTNQILHDVSTDRSALGIAVFLPEQLSLLRKALYIHDLSFVELARLNIFVFMRKRHPLAGRTSVSLSDLSDYPFVTYDQQKAPSYYSEECVFFDSLRKNVHVSDRATKMSILRSTDAFSIGADLPNFNLDIYFKRRNTELIALPFRDQPEPLRVGYLQKSGRPLGDIAKQYLEILTRHIAQLKLPEREDPPSGTP